jgi:hypothetical protein
MTLLIKDANSTTQPISTQADVAGNLVPVHVPASVVAGIATPISASNPLPVEVAAGSPAVVGDGTIVNAATAQTLFAGVTPVNGFSICNNCSSVIYVNDGGTAAAGIGFYVAATGGIYTTPPGYKPVGPVSIFGGTNAGNFAARRW